MVSGQLPATPPRAADLPEPSSLPRPWAATYPPGVPTDFLLPAVPVPRLLDDAVRDFPDHPAVVAGKVRLDHTTLADRVGDVAAALHEQGVASGDRVVVALPNLASVTVVLLAVWRLGAAAVPLATDASEAHAAAVLADAAPVALIGTRRSLRAVGEAAPSVCLQVDDDRWLTRTRRQRRRLARRVGRGGSLLEEVVAAGVRSAPVRTVWPDAPALIDYRPDAPHRGLVYTQAALVAGAFQARLWVPDVQAGREHGLVTEQLTSLEPLVLGWLAGLLAGGCVELVDAPAGDDLAKTIERSAPTLLTATPRRLRRLLTDADATRRDLSSLRVVLSCRGPLGPTLRSEVERRTAGARVRATFTVPGAGAVTHAQPVYGRAGPHTVGPPVTATTAAVVALDDSARLLPSGEPGRLVVHGPQAAVGVHGCDRDPWLDDGWAVSDHLGVVDTTGELCPLGPVTEVVGVDGSWIAPARIEAVLEDHPAVRRAGVVVEVTGRVRAGVVCRRRPRPEVAELTAHCAEQLDAAEVPDEIHLVDELPDTESGTHPRDQLRATIAGR